MKQKKKTCFLCAAVLALSTIPVAAFAEEEESTAYKTSIFVATDRHDAEGYNLLDLFFRRLSLIKMLFCPLMLFWAETPWETDPILRNPVTRLILCQKRMKSFMKYWAMTLKPFTPSVPMIRETQMDTANI